MGTKVGHTTTANMDAEQMTMLDVSLNEDIETQEGQDTLVNDENVGPKENAISDLNTAQLKKPKLSGIQRHTIDIVEASAATICSSMPLVETQHMQIDTTRSIAAGSGPNGARATASDNNQDVAEPNPVVTTKPNPVVTTKPNPVLRQTQLRESTVVVKSRTSVVSRSEDMPWSGLPPPKIKPLATPQQQLTPGKQARSGIRPPNTIVQQTPTKVIVTSTSGPGTAVLAGYESNLASLILKCEKAVERTVVPPKKNEKNPLRWKESNVKFGIFIKELKGYLRQLTQHAEEFRDHCVTVEQRLILDRQGEKARLKPVRVRAEKAEKALHATQQLLDEAKQYTEDLRNRLDNHDSSTKEEVEKMREASTGYREAVASLQTELDQLRRTHSHTLHTHKQAQQQSQLQIDAYRDKIEELRDTIDKKAEEVRSLQADLSNMANTAGTEEREIKFRDTRIADMEASIRKTTAESEALKERLQEKEVEMSKTLETFSMAQTSYLSQVNAFTANQSKDEKLIDDLKQQLSEAKQQLHDTTNEARSNSDDLNAQIKQLAEGQQAKDVELAEAKLQNKKLEASVEELVIKSKLTELKIDESNTELEDLRSQNSRLKNELERLAHQLQTKELSWQEEKATLKESNHTVAKAFEAANTQSNALTAQLSTLKDTLTESGTATNAAQIERLCKVTTENENLKAKMASLEGSQKNLLQARARIAELTDQVFATEMARRKLHNQVQDLKGKIRVCVRVRPLKNGCEDDQPPINYKGDGYGLSLLARGNRQPFSFDRVFQPNSTQEEVFDEVSQFVQSAIDGYNVCLFAYGQTGSGKTHTMQGDLTGDERGIIIRSAEKVLQNIKELGDEGWEYKLNASYFEIYNETVRDLLNPSDNTKGLAIRDNGTDQPYIEGLHSEVVSSVACVLRLVTRAESHRSVAGTDMNERSSRSHSVFVLRVNGEHKDKNKSVKGVMYLCDLAGSERLAKSGAEGDRLKETQAINKSLSSLADVCGALKTKSGHIPYRNSKLTHVLQPCLSGSGKALMLVALSPEEASASETMCSLRFAQQVSQTELGKAKAHSGDGTGSSGTATTANNTAQVTSLHNPRKRKHG